MLLVLSVPLAALPRCQDPPPHAAIDCGILSAESRRTGVYDGVESVLCPAIARIQRASCSTLADAPSLASLIGPVDVLDAVANPTRSLNLSAHAFTGMYMPGVVHAPAGLAELLVHLAHRHVHGPLRFVSTNSNNGWAACLAAAFLGRTHGAFHGLAVNGLKTEWATVRGVRVLLGELGLSWRHPQAFDAAADAALMSYHPHVRNSLTPTAFASATTLLPMA